MKFRYDKATGKVVEKSEPESDVIEMLPAPEFSGEYLRFVADMERQIRYAFGYRSGSRYS